MSGAEQEKNHAAKERQKKFNTWYNDILSKAQIVDNRYPVKGMPVMLPNGCFMHDKIMKDLEERWEENNIRRCLFPIAIPYDYLARESDHIAGFGKECYWINSAGDTKLEKPFALRPTSETAMYSMFALWIRSYADLPLKVYQTVSVYRYETKSTKPLIRVREIPWNEAHCAFPDAESAIVDLHKAVDIYQDIMHNKLHVYGLVLQRPEWDKFAGSVYTLVIDVIMPCGRVLQSAGLHYLGQKFSKAFDIKYFNNNNEAVMPHITCYGVSTRLLATAISIPGDETGLVLPTEIAPYQVVILAIHSKKEADNERVKEECERIAEALRSGTFGEKNKYRVLVDLGDEQIGAKYYRHEPTGIPIRIEMGIRDINNNGLMISNRKEKKKAKVVYKELSEVVEAVDKCVKEYTAILDADNKKFADEHVYTCTKYEDIAKHIDEVGGFVRVPFFLNHPSESISEDYIIPEEIEEAHKYDRRINEECGGEIRGFNPQDTNEDLEGLTCVFSGKPARSWVYIAKSY